MPEEVFFLIFRFLCLGKCFFLSSGSCADVSGTGYLQMGNKQTNKTPREPTPVHGFSVKAIIHSGAGGITLITTGDPW